MTRVLPLSVWLFIVAQLHLCTLFAQDEPGAGLPDSTDPLTEQAWDLERRSMAGDREAMKEILRTACAYALSDVPGGSGAINFGGIPDNVDRVALIMEIVSERPTSDEGHKVRTGGTEWLKKMRDPRAAELFRRIALDSSEDIWDRSTMMLGLTYFPQTGKDVFVQLSTNSDPEVRETVASAVGALKDPLAEQILLRLSQDSHRFVRATALSKLEYWRVHTAPAMRNSKPGNDTEGALKKDHKYEAQRGDLKTSPTGKGMLVPGGGLSTGRPLSSGESVQTGSPPRVDTFDGSDDRHNVLSSPWRTVGVALVSLMFFVLAALCLWRLFRRA